MSGNRKQAPKSRHDRGEREKPMASRQPKPDPDKRNCHPAVRGVQAIQLVQVQEVDRTPMCEKIWHPGHSDRDGDPPVIPALAAPDAQVLDPQVDIFGIERARYLGEMKSRQSRVDEIENNTKPIRVHMEAHVRRVEGDLSVTGRMGSNPTRLQYPTHVGSNSADSPKWKYGG